MPKRNREKLMEQSLYDLLCFMNKTMTQLQDEGHRVCIIDALGVESGYCKGVGSDCGKCLQNWLNEFPFLKGEDGMMNSEAISKIKFLLDVGGSDGFTSADNEALNMAINALSECKKPKTNGDRIRQMTDEELAEFFCQISQCCGNDASCSMCPIYDGCAQNVMCVERWLKQEAKDDAAD